MSIRPRVLAAALACLPVYLAASLMPAHAAAHARLPIRAALVRQTVEELVAPTGSPVIYVSNNTGNDANSGTSLALAKKTIQAGIDAVSTGGTVNIEPGTYGNSFNPNQTIPESRNYDLNPNGRDLILQSDPSNGGTPANTVIDFQGSNIAGLVLSQGITSATKVLGLTFQNSGYTGGNGGAISIGNCSPTVQNCVFLNNKAGFGGAITIINGSPVIRECTFTGNQAAPTSASNPVSTGGAIEIETLNSASSGTFAPSVINCAFSRNTAQTDGAAIDVSNGLQPLILNAAITNCTFTQNTSAFTDAADPGGAVGVYSANVAITNSILYGDSVGSGGGSGEITIAQLGDGSPNAVITASHNDIQGSYPGGNTNQNPLFAANLDLAAGSPAINIGTTGANIPTIDRTGRNRDSQPDLGAYEVLAPTANAQSVSVPFNTAKAVTLTASDPNVTPRALTYIVTSPPAYGTLSGSAPNLTYTPNVGYNGSDAFTFKVNNGTYDSAQVMVTLTVAAGVPTANSQTVAVPFNTAKAFTLTGSDPDTPPLALTYTITTSPAHGALTGTVPNLTYTPATGYHGADSFQFTVNNGSNTSSAATVTLNVATGVPTANAQSANVAFNTAKTITLTGTDPDIPALALTYAIATNPTHGSLSGFNASTGAVTYTPNSGYHGADSFTFTVSNGVNTSSPATVTLNVAAGVPTANAQSVSVAFNTAMTVTLTGTDPDIPALPLTYAVVTGPTHGTLSGTAPNLTYTPTPGYTGTDSFTFTVSNGTNTSTPATVSITVNPLFLTSLTFPTPVEGGLVPNGTVTLSGITPTDVVVGLSSTNSATIRIHRSVIVPAGFSSATFPIDTYRSHTTQTVTITAALNAVTLNKDLTITGR